MATEKAKKPATDWTQVEVDYRAGIKPLRQIAEENGISHVAVSKRAKRDGWSRDLKAKIVAAAEEKVSKAAVTGAVNAEKLVTEREVVEANADLQYRIRIEHRQDIGRARALFRTMLEELEVASSLDGKQLIKELMEIVSGPDEDESPKDAKRRAGRMRKAYEKIVGGPERIDSAKKLTEMLEKVIRMERQAFGIDDEEKGGGDLDKLLLKIHRERTGA